MQIRTNYPKDMKDRLPLQPSPNPVQSENRENVWYLANLFLYLYPFPAGKVVELSYLKQVI